MQVVICFMGQGFQIQSQTLEMCMNLAREFKEKSEKHHAYQILCFWGQGTQI